MPFADRMERYNKPAMIQIEQETKGALMRAQLEQETFDQTIQRLLKVYARAQAQSGS